MQDTSPVEPGTFFEYSDAAFSAFCQSASHPPSDVAMIPANTPATIMQIAISMSVNPLFIPCISMCQKWLHLLHVILIPNNPESCYDNCMRMKDITIEEFVEVIRNIVIDELKKLTKEDTKKRIELLIEALREYR